MRRYRMLVDAGSLVVGPLLMTVGDLIHPAEESDAGKQAALIVEHASRWYAAHLLLFIGILVFIPGILALTSLAASRAPLTGYIGRLLVLAGFSVFSAVFVVEMLVGRYISDGADVAAATALLEAFQSGWILSAVAVGALIWIVGVVLVTVPFVREGGQLRWGALIFSLGAVFILIEIVSAEVILSQIGNLLILLGGAIFAWHLFRSEDEAASA